MSSSASRSSGVHQDFIARIRFSNALPPPPCPPKLLDIPNTGLASGQYTTPGFASRLAREQPLNVEADAELGMPLDLVGMPGVFDGDERSIQAPAHTPQVHPHDRPLLRPLSTLGKPKVSEVAVSFLRRTEYISTGAVKRSEASPLRPGAGNAKPKRPEKRKSPEPDAGTPAYVRRKIEHSFAVTQKALRPEGQRNIRHPTRKGLRLVEAYPMIPDLDAFPDSGAYVTVKFATNPVSGHIVGGGTGTSKAYDTRLLSGIFKPIERSATEEAAYEAALEAWEQDPERNPKPSNTMNYDFYLPETQDTGDKFRAKFDVENPDRDDADLYTAQSSGQGCFQFARVRGYEASDEKELAHDTKYDEEIILSFTGDGNVPGGKVAGASKGGAVLYYPVMQRSTVRSQRGKNIAKVTGGFGGGGVGRNDEEIIDQLDVTLEDPNEEMLEHVARIKADPLHFHEQEEEEEEEQARAEEQSHEVRDDEDEDAPRGNRDGADSDDEARSPETNGNRRGVESEEDDAEGDEEE
ncbi:uncharacterized protein E0L32_011567 [Thyridium curvatum]|uniref:Uncharacterized protein n=1 Tax=Thyridium curvatum TaxID=1093900 RepID=A0A507BM00_9PEZI|nr:uncharacterized protein E0L32_011567 [Thyridium curvatum]TPX18529.1 hypothetical protein E0L32_011567 [Thyridium curvatum]